MLPLLLFTIFSLQSTSLAQNATIPIEIIHFCPEQCGSSYPSVKSNIGSPFGSYDVVGFYPTTSTGALIKRAGFTDPELTLESCTSRCSGADYISVLYGTNCECGVQDPGPQGYIGEGIIPCGGNILEACGTYDFLTNQIFQIVLRLTASVPTSDGVGSLTPLVTNTDLLATIGAPTTTFTSASSFPSPASTNGTFLVLPSVSPEQTDELKTISSEATDTQVLTGSITSTLDVPPTQAFVTSSSQASGIDIAVPSPMLNSSVSDAISSSSTVITFSPSSNPATEPSPTSGSRFPCFLAEGLLELPLSTVQESYEVSCNRVFLGTVLRLTETDTLQTCLDMCDAYRANPNVANGRSCVAMNYADATGSCTLLADITESYATNALVDSARLTTYSLPATTQSFLSSTGSFTTLLSVPSAVLSTVTADPSLPPTTEMSPLPSNLTPTESTSLGGDSSIDAIASSSVLESTPTQIQSESSSDVIAFPTSTEGTEAPASTEPILETSVDATLVADTTQAPISTEPTPSAIDGLDSSMTIPGDEQVTSQPSNIPTLIAEPTPLTLPIGSDEAVFSSESAAKFSISVDQQSRNLLSISLVLGGQGSANTRSAASASSKSKASAASRFQTREASITANAAATSSLSAASKSRASLTSASSAKALSSAARAQAISRSAASVRGVASSRIAQSVASVTSAVQASRTSVMLASSLSAQSKSLASFLSASSVSAIAVESVSLAAINSIVSAANSAASVTSAQLASQSVQSIISASIQAASVALAQSKASVIAQSASSLSIQSAASVLAAVQSASSVSAKSAISAASAASVVSAISASSAASAASAVSAISAASAASARSAISAASAAAVTTAPSRPSATVVGSPTRSYSPINTEASCPGDDYTSESDLFGFTYNINCGYFFSGDRLASFAIGSFDNCLQYCDITSECNAVVYSAGLCTPVRDVEQTLAGGYSNTQIAALATGFRDASEFNDDVCNDPDISGNSYQSIFGSSYTFTCSTAFASSSKILSIATDTIGACITYCDIISGCEAVAFTGNGIPDGTATNCDLLSRGSGTVSSSRVAIATRD